ncbi:MAG: M56 family metallopeptidase [Cellulosilyticaceae bacterium]
MGQILESIISASLYASFVGVVVMLVRLLLRQYITPFWRYALWGIVLAKLIVPMGPESSWSLFNLLQAGEQAISTQEQARTRESAEYVVMTDYQAPTVKQVDGGAWILNPWVVCWLVGVLGVGSVWVMHRVILEQRLRRGTLIQDQRVLHLMERSKVALDVVGDVTLLLQEEVHTPALLGIWKPRILLTSDVLVLEDDALEHILRHELAHFKRRDPWINMMLLGIQAIHWFNPVLWYLAKKVREDMELAADAKVAWSLAEGERLAYGHTLLRMLEMNGHSQTKGIVLGLADDKRIMKNRLEIVKKLAKTPKYPKRFGMIGIVLFVGLGALLLTSSQKPFEEPTGAGKLYQYRTPYVGNNSKVIGLIDALEFAEYRGDVHLRTQEKPYEIQITYDFKDTQMTRPMVLAKMSENVEIIFGLVENVDFVTVFMDHLMDMQTSSAIGYSRGGTPYVQSLEELETLINVGAMKSKYVAAAGETEWTENEGEESARTLMGEIIAASKGQGQYAITLEDEGRQYAFAMPIQQFESYGVTIGDRIKFNRNRAPAIVKIEP